MVSSSPSLNPMLSVYRSQSSKSAARQKTSFLAVCLFYKVKSYFHFLHFHKFSSYPPDKYLQKFSVKTQVWKSSSIELTRCPDPSIQSPTLSLGITSDGRGCSLLLSTTCLLAFLFIHTTL